MKEINSSSEKISNFNRATEEIAFRTGILALSAAVEAAGKGEEGLGLAVVADERRNLAHRGATYAGVAERLGALASGNSGSSDRTDGRDGSLAQFAAVSTYSADLSALDHSLDEAGRPKAFAPVGTASLSHGRNKIPMEKTESNF
jgi:methyl-accepting chemotaxis protein